MNVHYVVQQEFSQIRLESQQQGHYTERTITDLLWDEILCDQVEIM
jgi:hypothetical protein